MIGRTLGRGLVGAAIATVALCTVGFTGVASAAPSNGNFGDLTQPQPDSNADQNGTGANPGTCEPRNSSFNTLQPNEIYCSTRHGLPSANGNGNGAATGRPCAGCVGRADNKNPVGQGQEYPSVIDGRLIQPDRNQGYECDGNNGIGKSNPAHTLCDP